MSVSRCVKDNITVPCVRLRILYRLIATYICCSMIAQQHDYRILWTMEQTFGAVIIVCYLSQLSLLMIETYQGLPRFKVSWQVG